MVAATSMIVNLQECVLAREAFRTQFQLPNSVGQQQQVDKKNRATTSASSSDRYLDAQCLVDWGEVFYARVITKGQIPKAIYLGTDWSASARVSYDLVQD